MSQYQPASNSYTQTNASSQPKLWLWIVGLIVATFFCYAPVLSGDKEFTNWDDDQYVTNQPLITALDGAHVRKLFDPSTVVAFNYHPLTMLSLAIDYQRGYDEDTQTISISPFVQTNLLFHLLNTVLVFLLLYQLTQRKNVILAAIAALLFGIHPLHVESVAWIAERKDVLYCCFLLLSVLTYLRYLSSSKLGWLGLSFICFIASVLSKAMAVPLPFILLLTDYLYKRRFSIRLLLEKLPFFLVAIMAGIHTLSVQKGALIEQGVFSVADKLLFGAGAFVRYCIKLIAPINLSAFYPYPDANAGGSLPAFYYLAPILVLALIGIPFFGAKRKAPERIRMLVWGIGFFILMLVLVLPVIGVGSTIMADRYTYVSSIGLLFLIPALLHPVMHHLQGKRIVLGSLGVLVLFFAVRTYARVPVWHNSQTLWADVVQQYPLKIEGKKITNKGVKTAYKNLADYYVTHDEYDTAFSYYQVLMASGVQDAEVWNNIGNIYVAKKDLPNALNAFDKAIQLDTTNADMYQVRAIIKANTADYPAAVQDMEHVIRLKPDDAQAKAMKADMLEHIRTGR